MAHFLVSGEVQPQGTGGGHLSLGDLAGQGQQDTSGQLIIQIAAFDVPRGGDGGAGVKAHHIPVGDAQGLHLLLGEHLLVQHHFHGVKGAGSVGIVGVNVGGGVVQLESTGVHLALPGVDAHILPLTVVGAQAAHVDDVNAALSGDAGDHAAQGVQVGQQQQAIFLGQVGGEIHQHRTLSGDLGLKTQLFELVVSIFSRLMGVPGGAVNGQQGQGLLDGVIYHVFHHISLLALVIFCVHSV